MSGLGALPTLIDVERTSTDLEVSVRLPNGEAERWVFGLNDESTAKYRVVRVGYSLDDPPAALETVDFTFKNEQGDTLMCAVETDELKRFLPVLQKPQQYPVLTGILYGDDYITLRYLSSTTGVSEQMTLGADPDFFRYTWKSYATNWLAADRFNAPYLAFYFTDEAGKTWESTFTAPLEEIKRFCLKLNAYIKRYNSPKPDAAIIPNVLQQAA